MVVGIVSDTHGFFHPALPAAFESADHIFHAGDIGKLDILDQLNQLAPTTAVWGNIDGMDVRRETREFETMLLNGVSFLMTHIAGRPGNLHATVAGRIRNVEPDVFICGHSHILQIERLDFKGRPLFVNPGAAGRQGLHTVKTCVRLMIDDGNLSNAEVIHLDQ